MLYIWHRIHNTPGDFICPSGYLVCLLIKTSRLFLSGKWNIELMSIWTWCSEFQVNDFSMNVGETEPPESIKIPWWVLLFKALVKLRAWTKLRASEYVLVQVIFSEYFNNCESSDRHALKISPEGSNVTVRNEVCYVLRWNIGIFFIPHEKLTMDNFLPIYTGTS